MPNDTQPIIQPAASAAPVQDVPVVSDQSPTSVNDDTTQTIGDELVTQGVLTPEQYEDAKLKSASEGRSVESILTDSHIVPEDKIVQAKAKLLGVPYISLTTASFSPQALSKVPQAVASRFTLIPLTYDEKEHVLSLAMSNPADLDALSFVQQKTGLQVKTYAASSTDIQKAIAEQYKQELIGDVGEAVQETEDLNKVKTVDSTQIAQIIKEAPIAKIVSTILEYALNSRASDVHIEPQEDRVRVRYRIDGILYDKLSLPKTVQEALISRIKILAEMKIDEHRSPQDGRFNFKAGDQEVDLRISLLPAVDGEKIVMRLLRKSGTVPTLQELGLSGVALKNLETAILRPHGIIIVCGPTGSGKTTTLYSVLSRLNTTRVNISSLEDPVEYKIQGVNQVQINPAVGLTFASGLKSFLRQDPNIILVGEIRDNETSELALQAALTGHLVFSTLHTSDAAGVLPRLIDLGAEKFLLASTMNAVLGQRIVRKICPHCIMSYPPPSQILEEIKKELGPLFPTIQGEVKLYKGKGCIECGNAGYLGRVGIFEVMPMSDKLSRLVLEHPDSDSIQKEAVVEGMITMKQDGYMKVLQGVTTIEEVLRVAQE